METAGSPASVRSSATRDALVVGADPDLVTFLSGVLEPEDWAIRQAPNNAAAMDAASRAHFDLIITGAQTSGQEDVELLRKVRRARPHTRLIILTNKSTPMDVVASMREHAFSYFSWPCSLDDLAAMIRHASEEPCWDDGIEVLSATPAWIRTLVRCELKTADRLLRFLDEIADLPDEERHDVAQAFREMLLNAIEHGGQFDPAKCVEIEYVRADRAVTCRIADPGPGFKLNEVSHAALTNPTDDPVKHMALREELGMRPGGFGILLTQHLIDEMVYNETGNEVLLIKYLVSPKPSLA